MYKYKIIPAIQNFKTKFKLLKKSPDTKMVRISLSVLGGTYFRSDLFEEGLVLGVTCFRRDLF